MTGTAENDARPLYLYVLPDRWDHAIRAAHRFAQRDGRRYEVRWFPPRGLWRVRVLPPGTGASE